MCRAIHTRNGQAHLNLRLHVPNLVHWRLHTPNVLSQLLLEGIRRYEGRERGWLLVARGYFICGPRYEIRIISGLRGSCHEGSCDKAYPESYKSLG